MIFRRGTDEPVPFPPGADRPVPVWDAVAATQQKRMSGDWFIPQSDHAHLSGTLAGHFDPELVPGLTPEILQAVRRHDEGWTSCDGLIEAPLPPTVSPDGHALSFFQIPPSVFLAAWQRSIDAAVAIGPAAGHIVSSHFRILAERRLATVRDTPEDSRAVKSFAAFELLRQASLAPASGFTADQLARFLTVLQFCDVMSLYLCSNPEVPVVFPQDFGRGTVSAYVDGGGVHVRPRFFAEPFEVTISWVRLSGEEHTMRSETVHID